MDESALSVTTGPRPTRPLTAWQAYLLAFIASACSLIIELVAGRIMAPLVGVSLYTWTSIIGVVLAGISLGNFIGGKLADRFASRQMLGILFLVSGLAALSVLYTTPLVAAHKGPTSFSLLLRIVLLTGAIFFLPSCVLGTISPLLVKLTLRNLDRSGDVVGKIYAVSTAGSIVGTFATGFYLIALFGTRTIILGVGVTCLLLGALFGDWAPRPLSKVVRVILLIAIGLAAYRLAGSSSLKSDCLRETNYYCIKLQVQTTEGEETISLILDHLVHSFNSLQDPERLTYPYEYMYAALTEYVARQRPERQVHALFIGGGGYTFPRYIQSRYPGSRMDVLEIDPQVTQVAIERLGLDPRDTIRTLNLDARLALENMPADQVYDVIVGDAFNGYGVPYHLTTKEFNDRARQHLAPGGIYMLNIIDGRRGEFARSEARTLRATFPYVAAMPVNEEYTNQWGNLWVMLGSDRPLNRPAYLEATQTAPRPDLTSHLWDGEKLDQFLASGYSVLLTDDYVPVDNLLAPVFEEAGF